MRFSQVIVLTGLAFMAASGARAADLRPGSLPPAPVIEDDIETWYLRGDVGYAASRRPEAGFAASPFTGDFVQESMGGATFAGFGVGYRFGPQIRADVTLDHRFHAPFKGHAPFAAPSITDRGQFQSSTLMLNAYADLETTTGLTPYLGAGLGVARNVLSGYSRVSEDAATGLLSWEHLGRDSDYSLAWALMAGMGFQLSSSLTLDLGYRFVSLGEIKTREYGAGKGADVKAIGAHDVRLSVRYAFP